MTQEPLKGDGYTANPRKSDSAGEISFETASMDSRLSRLQRRAQFQMAMLAAQYLLGMGMNLIGAPIAGATRLASGGYFALEVVHILIAIGLVVGAVLTIWRANPLGTGFGHLAWLSGLTVGLTFIAGVATGVLTMAAPSNAATASGWLSFLMAVGFIAAFLLYGRLYLLVRLDRASQALDREWELHTRTGAE